MGTEQSVKKVAAACLRAKEDTIPIGFNQYGISLVVISTILSENHLKTFDIRLLENLRGVLIKQRKIQYRHWIFHKSASTLVTGISR